MVLKLRSDAFGVVMRPLTDWTVQTILDVAYAPAYRYEALRELERAMTKYDITNIVYLVWLEEQCYRVESRTHEIPSPFPEFDSYIRPRHIGTLYTLRTLFWHRPKPNQSAI